MRMRDCFKEIGMATVGLALSLSLVACSGGTEGAVDTGDTTKTTETKQADDKADDKKGDDKETTTDDDMSIQDLKDQYADETAHLGYEVVGGMLMEPRENGYETGKHIATIEVEDYGTIQLELDADAAPITVSNFAELANTGFYDGLTFHRIMRNFMIQGGDPLGNGTGGSQTSIKGEFSSNGVDTGLIHERGTISMARSNDPNSASSQFFICDADDDFLDGNYAAFGHVIKGMDVVDAIAKDAKPTDDNGTIKPAQQPTIKSIRVGDGSLG